MAASAAATAESQAVGGHAGMTVTLARTMVADIAASTKAYLAERMQSFEQEIATLRQRVVDLEARTYQGHVGGADVLQGGRPHYLRRLALDRAQ